MHSGKEDAKPLSFTEPVKTPSTDEKEVVSESTEAKEATAEKPKKKSSSGVAFKMEAVDDSGTFKPNKDSRFAALSTAQCFGTILVVLLPVIGTIIGFCYAGKKRKFENKRSIAKACLIFKIAFIFELFLLVVACVLIKKFTRFSVLDYLIVFWMTKM